MNVLYVSSLYPPAIGGAQIQLHHLARAMQHAGDDVQVLTYSGKNREDWLRFATVSCEAPGTYTYEDVPVTRLGFSAVTRARMLPWALGYYGMIGPATRAIARLTEPYVVDAAGEPDLIHLTRIGREFIARACLDYARKRDVPFVLTPNHHPRWRGWRYGEYDKLYREADALVVYTEAEKETVVRDVGVQEDRVWVTGVGPIVTDTYDVAAFRRAHDLEDTRYVLFLGQQYEYKGMGPLLQAAEAVWQEYPHVHFVFVGPHTGHSRELFAHVTDTRVHNLGAVDFETKAAALAGCEFLCMPSSQESFGGVYVESWCYRRAVIGGDIPAIRCVIDEGENGLLSSQEPAELAAAIRRLLADSALCERMGAAGQAKAEARYSWRQLATETRRVYDALLSGKRSIA